jgi:hypothetical protein
MTHEAVCLRSNLNLPSTVHRETTSANSPFVTKGGITIRSEERRGWRSDHVPPGTFIRERSPSVLLFTTGSAWPLRRFTFGTLTVKEFQSLSHFIGGGQILTVTDIVHRYDFPKAISHINHGRRLLLLIKRTIEAMYSSIIIHQHRERQVAPLFVRIQILGGALVYHNDDCFLFREIFRARGCVLKKTEFCRPVPGKHKNQIGPSAIIRDLYSMAERRSQRKVAKQISRPLESFFWINSGTPPISACNIELLTGIGIPFWSESSMRMRTGCSEASWPVACIDFTHRPVVRLLASR